MKELIPVRHSHLLRHCAVGAVVRGPHELMVVMDTRFWTDRNGQPAGRPLRYVDRVRAAFGIKQELLEPPIAKEGIHNHVEGVCIPARKFPRWGRCPSCGLLHYLPVLKEQERFPRCRETDREKCRSRPRLEQVTYVLVHKDGYLDDVPWHYLAHPAQSPCRVDNHHPYLRLTRDRIDGERLTCQRCRSVSRFNYKDKERRIKQMHTQPWLNEWIKLDNKTSPEIMKVNEVGIHFPKCREALVIPPESRIRKGTVVDRLYSSVEKRRLMESCRTPLQRKSTLRRIAGEFRCDTAAVETAWKEIQDGYPVFDRFFNITPGQLRQDEYKALIEIIPDVSDDEDFVTCHHSLEWRRLSEKMPVASVEWHVCHALDRLVAINRLKEIQVLEGFSRTLPADEDQVTIVPPDISGQSDWLPAIELFGEGLFITFDPARLEAWEKTPEIIARADAIRKRYEANHHIISYELLNVTPRFLLLHTFAHLLIRQLESDAGYPAASLNERIFCNEGDFPMAGILIYVAVADIAGSLGGIMEMAEPNRFLVLAAAAVAHSRWCSLDPVCSEHEGQGLHLLNRAACHACLLIPEPACKYKNALLDRVLVKGDPENGIPGFFDGGISSGE